MSRVPSTKGSPGIVDAYIGTAYDTVKLVADNLDSISDVVKLVADNLDSISDVVALLEDITVSGMTVSETPPLTPKHGAQWTRCSDMTNFTWYQEDAEDAESGQWVETNPRQVSELQNNIIHVTTTTYVQEEAPTASLHGDKWLRCSDIKSFIWLENVIGDYSTGAWVEDNPSNIIQIDNTQELPSVPSSAYFQEEPPTVKLQGTKWTRCTDMLSFIWVEDVEGVPSTGGWIEDSPSRGSAQEALPAISELPPENPRDGEPWIRCSDMVEFRWINDGIDKQWVSSHVTKIISQEGATGTFTSSDGKLITVSNGIIKTIS